MDHKEQLLAYIVEASAPNKSDANPYGFCYLEAGHVDTATELHNDELIQALVASRDATGNFPVRPTDAGVKWASAAQSQVKAPAQAAPFAPAQVQQAAQAAQAAPAAYALPIEAGIPIPEKRAFGRKPGSGTTQVDAYGFDRLEVNQSFFVLQDNPPKMDDEGKPIAKHRSFSSVVSQANKRLHPKNFVVREYTQPEGQPHAGETGARVWRVEDMKGERPHRERKPKLTPSTAPAAAPFAGNGGGGPFNGPGPGGFPGGFAAPGPGFGGFPAPAPQAADWPAPPVPLPPFGS